LRGFSEALRRELAGSGIGVTYAAPRTTRTTINSDAVYKLSSTNGAAVDEPAAVASAIIEAIVNDRNEIYIGWPEKLAVRLNALLPRLISLAIGKQAAAARNLLRSSRH
jgi:short-subunit dehydrogenase